MNSKFYKLDKAELINYIEELENKIKTILRNSGKSNIISKSEVEGLLE